MMIEEIINISKKIEEIHGKKIGNFVVKCSRTIRKAIENRLDTVEYNYRIIENGESTETQNPDGSFTDEIWVFPE